MLKILLKKQLWEVFRSYFYDAKKNRMRSKGGIIAFFAFFIVIMVGMLGGIFTVLSVSLCEPLLEVGLGWLYFVLMGGIAIMLGAFGSVFNTYSGLYLAKDNDLLLSLPIPVSTIVTARLINVYLMGTLYAAIVLIPMLIVYWVTAGLTAARLICGLILFVIITTVVLLLSCLLGWVVAKISQKLKNKSFITVIIALVCVGAYYYFYFNASTVIQNLLLHAEEYGEKIRGAAYGLYLFGRIGEGGWGAAALFAAITAAASALVWLVLSRTFLGIATAGGTVARVRYTEKAVRQKSASGALLWKELKRFTTSPSYMLNCGLGLLLIPALAITLLIKGEEVMPVIVSVFGQDSTAVLLSGVLCMLASMNDIAAPSVSLEGKSIWIPQSLPVSPRQVLWAKVSLQLLLTGVPMLFAGFCAGMILQAPVGIRLMVFLQPILFTFFLAVYGTVISVRMPLLNWTSENTPIKQSGAVLLVLFSGWGFCIVPTVLYMLLLSTALSAALYLLIWAALCAVAALLLLRWLNTRGSALFAEA